MSDSQERSKLQSGPTAPTAQASTDNEHDATPLDGFDGLWRRVTVTTDDGALLRAYIHEPKHHGPDNTEGNYPTFVFAHGWTLTHRSWRKVVNLFVVEGEARIVLWDQRGHGDSTLEDGKAVAGVQSIERLGDDMATILSELATSGHPVILGGHSLGGMAVVSFAKRHPDVLAARVHGVALVGTSVKDIAAVNLPGGSQLLKLADALPVRPGRLVPARAEKWFAFSEGASDEDARDVAAQTGSTLLSTTGAFYEAVRDIDAVDALDALDGFPVQIIVGADDQLTPPDQAELIADHISTAHLEVIPKAGHLVLYENPERIHDILRQLAVDAQDLPDEPDGSDGSEANPTA